jgi:hypothetical protein
MSLLTSASSTLRAFLISPDVELSADFRRVADEVDAFKIARTVTKYPSPEELVRLIRFTFPTWC